jgi:6-phosphogluconolactonase
MPEVWVVEDADELAVRAADALRAAIDQALRERGLARVALSGGSTPGGAYRRLGKSGLDVARCRWFFVDDRAVPPEHARSNYRAAKADLFDPAGVPPEHVHRMKGELGATEGAEEYARTLETHLDDPLDLVVAGIGDDGHTASLFPGTGAVRESERVVAVVPGGALEPRISLGRRELLSARKILVLVSGSNKQAALAAALTPGDEDEVPARLYLAAPVGVVTFITDRASRLDTASDGR